MSEEHRQKYFPPRPHRHKLYPFYTVKDSDDCLKKTVALSAYSGALGLLTDDIVLFISWFDYMKRGHGPCKWWTIALRLYFKTCLMYCCLPVVIMLIYTKEEEDNGRPHSVSLTEAVNEWWTFSVIILLSRHTCVHTCHCLFCLRLHSTHWDYCAHLRSHLHLLIKPS